MHVLVITTLNDESVDMVASHLPNARFTIVDPRKYPNDMTLSYITTGSEHRVFVDNVRVDTCDVAWFRKPEFHTENELGAPTGMEDFFFKTYQNFVKWIYAALPNAFWVSDPWAVLRANNKVLQMERAKQLGFNIPSTLISNDAELVRGFMEETGICVVKPLTSSFMSIDGKVKGMFTNLITNPKSINFEGLRSSPVIFQQALVGVDVRVTVIGREVCPCLILKSEEVAHHPDWRVFQFDGELTYILDDNFPTHLAQKCVRLVSELGLVYGAFDFIKIEDEYFFLEVNPNGQWGFIELETGFSLSKIIADFFLSV